MRGNCMKQSSFSFTKPIIENLTYSMKQDCDITKMAGQQFPIEIGTDVGLMEAICEAVVKITLKVNNDTFPYDIVLVMSTKVKWEEDVSKEMLESILNKNIPATLLSYARPIISLITSYSNYKPFDLPFLDLRNPN